ncbi:MAG: hypothetical protein ACRDSJ_15265 [Rubrobacteraceae bacterium]
MSQSPGEAGNSDRRLSSRLDAIHIDPDAPRPATILRVADELESRGAEILELFREVTSPEGQAVFPIHLRWEGREFFLEVETGPWEERVSENLLSRVLVLRSSDKADAELGILSAYPVPEDLEFLVGRAPAALLQLDLLPGSLDRPEDFAELFRLSAGKRWGTELEYSVEYLPLVEELLIAALDPQENGGEPPMLDALVEGLGCFLGETIRRGSPSGGEWKDGEEWGESVILECGEFSLDPVGKARAFLTEGAGDSISFYADFVLEEIKRSAGEAPE